MARRKTIEQHRFEKVRAFGGVYGGGEGYFQKLLEEIRILHDKKEKDYGSLEDPLHNVRVAAEFGVEPWVGTMIRLSDKVQRTKTLARRGTLENEGAEDAFKDIAVYALLALYLYRESHGD
jgi:hypothetical protein